MEQYKKEFIDLLIETGALKFGEFTLKSGRKSPYFVNMGGFADGLSLSKLSYYYASKIMEAIGPDTFDIIFGPAYKGIPLAAGTCYSLYSDFQQNKAFAFDRKEIKDYGYDKTSKEGQIAKHIVGAAIKPGHRIVIIDDVFTSGAAKYEAIELLQKIASQLTFRAVLFAVDRQEVKDGDESAVEQFTKKTGIPTVSIISTIEIMDYLVSTGYLKGDILKNMVEYLESYGTRTIRQELDRFKNV